MYRKIFFITSSLFLFLSANAQRAEKVITETRVSQIEKILSADDMEGRKIFTPGIEKAADFIASQFKAAGLNFRGGLKSYHQKFSMVRQKSVKVSGTINGTPVKKDEIISIGTEPSLKVNEKSGFQEVVIDTGASLFRSLSPVMNSDKPTIVWISPRFQTDFKRLKFFGNRAMTEGAVPVFLVLNDKADNFSFSVQRDTTVQSLENIIGVIPGKSRKNEYVVFSAHYDHLGIGKPDAQGDSIYNGANDDASGTTAVIMLAKYFKALNQNERTLIFVTFTGEESGGYGSRYFSTHIPPENIVAMFNIEMIGTESKWGENSAYITGYERSDFGSILQRNLKGSKFHFEPDPYPSQNLFYRSDNATLAALGVPAHTISTSKMDNEPNYHKQSDNFNTLDMKNMTEIIKSIALSSASIVKGKDTPTRIPPRER